MRLKDKVCLITGGAAGIGRATAEKFVQEGAVVAFADLNEAAGRETAAVLGPRAAFQAVNVAERAAVQQWVDAVIEQFGRVDVLVNNAGIVRDAQLVKFKDGQVAGQMSEEAFDAVMNVNVKGVFNCAQAVVPAMVRQGAGVILNASSVVGLDGNFGQSNYVASKAAVVGMTRVWARELGRYGIRVNAVAPGFIATEMLLAVPEKVLEHMRGRIPLGRLGEAAEVANAYAFLASDEARFINGAVLRVDGGLVVGT
ncbi:MAG: glucose 1-dehydrogenase [Chloroflexi bacterium]|nr:glucose 1-dehydrogenase [Chloroflexota bacterium]MCI0646307.1 glucose 1-dehydrogenase [Chloroflexota bacterium]MCI0730295.1 glucose 1-dehydrogenase [Chloroflexota bacterium]